MFGLTFFGSVLGYAAMMLDEAVDPGMMNDYLKTILSEGMRIREIVRALLDFPRQRDFTMERVDITQALRDTLALVRRHATLSNIAIEEKYDPELPLVEVDVPPAEAGLPQPRDQRAGRHAPWRHPRRHHRV